MTMRDNVFAGNAVGVNLLIGLSIVSTYYRNKIKDKTTKKESGKQDIRINYFYNGYDVLFLG